jgi:threonine/homoserine/homoserine lactone efflux protein
MTWTAIAAFLAVDLLLVFTPGADWAFAIASGLGDRPVFPAVAGLVAGYGGYTVLVATGLAVLVAQTPGLLTGLTVAGAAYLLWLGGATLARTKPRARDPGSAGIGGARDGSPWRTAARGAAVSGLNPKGFLLYLALLPQFVHAGHDWWPVAAQLAVLGVLHMSDCAVVYSAVGTLSRVVLRARVTAARILSRVSGAAMIIIGAALLFERFWTSGVLH